MSTIDNAAFLITGGSGSLGIALAKHIVENYNPQTIRMMSRDEYRQHLAREQFDHEKLNWIIGDIQDIDRVMMATRHIDVVINAAALKRIETAEKNPLQCVYTNVLGVANIINACMTHNTPVMFQISTDKAVLPVTLYGKSKSVSEDLVLDANVYSKSPIPRFSVGRFGNFVSSNGSVEELFAKQKAEGKPLTVTHKDMKRFYITPEDAAAHICKWIDIMDGGEIFIPHMVEKHILTIAKSISNDIEFIGLRGYEKIEEELFAEQEKLKMKEFENYYVIK
jgi:UDP-N-acetylglucosamine 4,6-dehydratase/5-epimerase